jgi:acyl carrier protein
MDIRSDIRSFLKNSAPKDAGFTDSESLLVKGVIDSLRMLDMISFLEENYHLKIDEEELMPENFESVDAITRFVEQRIKREE